MRKLLSALTAAAVLGGSLLVSASGAAAGTDKVKICHATGTDKYVEIEISKDGTANGHAGSSHQDGRDIIPAYSWIENGVRQYFDGQNLDKLPLLAAGCKGGAEQITAGPVPPTYVPASCQRPTFPNGEVVLPKKLGDGVESADVQLSPDGLTWVVTYKLVADTDEKVYTWPVGVPNPFTFTVVPLSADPMWIVDSKTGQGQCEMPDTGAADYILPVLAGAAAIGLGALAVNAGRTRKTS